MSKSLKVYKPTHLAKQPEMELLVSHNPARKPSRGSIASRTKLHIALFLLGFVGSIGCLWVMVDTHNSKVKMEKLGLHKVANSLDNILSLLAYPVLLFSIISMAAAVQQLYLMYREVNNPETYRKRRERVAAEKRSN